MNRLKIPTRLEKFEVGIEKVNHDAVETSSKNLRVILKLGTCEAS